MKKLFILFLFYSFNLVYASKVFTHVKFDGLVIEEETLEPLQFVDIQVWLKDSLWFEFESDEDGYFEVLLRKKDTYDLVIEMAGYHTQKHPGMVVEETKVHGRFDVFLIPSKLDTVDLHCHERCWCIYHENYNRLEDTLSHLKGQLINEESLRPLSYSFVEVFKNGLLIMETQTNYSGKYFIDSIPSDTYSIHFSDFGFKTLVLEKVWIPNSGLKWIDVHLEWTDAYRLRNKEWMDAYYYTPPIDLFAEEQRMNDSLAAVMPSSEFQEAKIELNLIAYPNPFRTTLILERLPENDEIKIVDIMGNVLKTVATRNKSTVTLDLTSLHKGLYFIHYTEEGKEKNYGIVKK